MKKMSSEKQIKNLRSLRTALLKQRDLSMKGRMYTQDQVQQQKPKKQMKKTFLVTIYER